MLASDPILRAIKKAGFEVTAADVAVASGLPVHEVEPRLRTLAKAFRCALRVDRDGHLVYAFERPLRRWREGRATLVIRAAIKTFEALRTCFKVLFACAVLFYALLFTFPFAFLAGTATAIVVLSALDLGNSDDDALSLYVLVGAIIAILYTLKYVVAIARFTIALGRPSASSPKGTGGLRVLKGLAERVFAFVVGPSLPKLASADSAVLLQAAREKGWLLPSDVAELTLEPLRAAEQRAARLVVEHLGEPYAVPPGVVACTFPELAVTTGVSQPQHESDPSQVPFTGNPRRTDIAVGSFLALNVLAGLVVVVFVEDPSWLRALLGFVPLCFGLASLSLAAIRWPLFAGINRRIRLKNARRALYQEVFQAVRAGRDLTTDHLARLTLGNPELASQVVADLEGGPDVEGGRPQVLVFPSLSMYMEAARTLATTGPEKVGPIIWDSERGT